MGLIYGKLSTLVQLDMNHLIEEVEALEVS